MLTSITEVTRNASKASRGLVQISSRLTQVLDDSSKTGAKLKDIYGGLGIELMDSNGQIRSTYDILEDLSKQWDNLSKNEQEYIALTSAGSNQVQNFSALMENFAVAIDATTTAYNSSGSAAKENEKAMDTIEKKTELLRSQFEQLILGEGGLQSFAKGLLDVGIGALQLVNDLGGLKTVLVALVGVIATIKADSVLNGLTKITNIIPNLITNVSKLGTVFDLIVSSQIDSALSGGATQAMSLSEALTAAGISASAAQIAMGGLFAIIAAGTIIYSKWKQSEEEAAQAALDSAKAFDSYENTISDTLSQIENESTSRNGLISIIKQLDKAYDEEKDSLKDVNDLRDEAIQKLYEEAQAKAKQTIRETGSEYVKAKKFLENPYTVTIGSYSMNYDTPKKALEDLNKRLDQYNEKIQRGEKLTTQEQTMLNAITDKYNGLNDTLEETTTIVDTYDNSVKTTKQSEEEWLESNRQSAEESNDALSQLTDEQAEDLDSLQEKYSNLSDLSVEQLNKIAEAMLNNRYSAEEAAEKIGLIEDQTVGLEDATKNLESALSDLTNMASAYDTLSNAVNEYNANGSLTLGTLSNLTALGSDYISLLEVENGQMSINEQGLANLANSYIDEAEAKAYDKAMAELANATNKDLNATNRAGLSAGQASASGSNAAGTAAWIAAQNAAKGAPYWDRYWKSATAGQFKGVSATKITNVGKSLQTQLAALESFRKSIGKNTVSAIKNTKATGGSSKARGGNSKATKANTKAVDDNTKALKANVDALKEQKEALEKEVDDYKKVIDYLNDKVDEEIDKLEEARDAEVQAIEDRIDEYEKLADAQEESIDNEIDKLKEAKDAEEEYWNAQIDELEKANDAMEEQAKLEQLLQNLENARRKKVKVYREGKGFVYETDQDEVAKAKKELEDYQNQKALEDQINLLKKNRDDALSVYDKQIADLEDYKKRQKAKYDAIIEDLKKQVEQIKAKYDVPINALKEWKETFKKQTEAYEQEIARQLTIQKTGIDTESANWTTRLNNLDAFVSAYNAKLKELDDVTSKLESAEKAYNQAQQSASSYDYDDSGDGGGGGGGGGGGSSEPSAPKTGNYKVLKFEKKFSNKTKAQKYIESLPVSQRGQYAFLEHDGAYYVYKKSNYKSYQGITASQAANYAQAYRGSAMYWAYASGAAKIGSNQMALVGDDPKHRELVIGSKLNGTAMQLSKGSGVVNAKSTNTFAGLLNALGSALNDGSAKGSILNNNSDNSSSMYIDKVVIEGSHITDIVSFKNSLMNLKSEATQRAYKHK